MNFTSNNRPVIFYRSVILLLLLAVQTAYGQTVQLPFLDDFSTTQGTNPNPSLWINGGTFINNTFPINQPSKFVATFDGRNATGVPYDYNSQLAYGKTDSLTSRLLNLAVYSPADSLYLSFFWQAKGLGDLPDEDDTLMVSFLNKKNLWVPVWKKAGGIRNDNFQEQLIAIKDTSFLHAGFQFRFETKGRQSGAFDTWHIDYVYLNKNRRYNDIYLKDVSCTRFTSSYLKRYTAMPMRQYLVNPAAEVRDTISAEVFNLYSEGSFLPFGWKIEDIVSGTVYLDKSASFFGSLPPRLTERKHLLIDPITGFNSAKAILKFQLSLTTTDAQQPDIPGYDLSVNDSVSTYTILDDFYAYDDGTAETGADYDQNFGKVAVQYILSKPDSLGAVRFNFSPYFTNPYLKDTEADGGQYFLLQILDSNKGKPGKVLYQKDTIRIQYGKIINHFVEYPLSINVAVKDTFYVSWSKLTKEVIAVGVDKNTPQFADKIFYNNGSEWLRNSSIRGSLMVRPVLATKPRTGTGPGNEITSTEEPFGQPLQVYPNPANQMLHWNVQGVRQIRITDVRGRELLSQKVDGQDLDISRLPAGTYFVNFSDGKKNLIRKIVVLH